MTSSTLLTRPALPAGVTVSRCSGGPGTPTSLHPVAAPPELRPLARAA